MNVKTFMLGLAGAAALGAGCGPVAPDHPTWKNDVRPIIVSRCVRCHNAQDSTTPTGEIDHLVTGPLAALPPAFNFDYATIADVMAGASFSILQMTPKYVRSTAPVTPLPLFMPPPPAEALSDWQIEIFDKWAKDPR